MLKILGAGLPRTGTRTLYAALRILGYKAIHHTPTRMPLFPSGAERALVSAAYADVDAVTDCPAALYWQELLSDNSELQIILTTRDVHTWWQSIKWHTYKIRQSADMEHIRYTDAMHGLLFGVAQPCEYWWKRRFIEHHHAVRSTVPSGRLLVLDIVGGDKWDVLCPFLGVKEPDTEWPWLNKREPQNTRDAI